jgi:DnaJ-class molecular chaperone
MNRNTNANDSPERARAVRPSLLEVLRQGVRDLLGLPGVNEHPCSDCAASGECEDCGGSGARAVETPRRGLRVPWAEPDTRTCPSCMGEGACGACAGRGRRRQ